MRALNGGRVLVLVLVVQSDGGGEGRQEVGGGAVVRRHRDKARQERMVEIQSDGSEDTHGGVSTTQESGFRNEEWTMDQWNYRNIKLKIVVKIRKSH